MEKGWVRWLRGIVATIGFAGGLVFVAAFAWSYVDPVAVERMARAAIAIEVQHRVDRELDRLDVRLERLDDSAIASIARRLSEARRAEADQLRAKAATLREFMRKRVPVLIQAISVAMDEPDCDCRRRAPGAGEALLEMAFLHLASGSLDAHLEQVEAELQALIRTRYQEVAASLLREFRIFTAANSLVLLFLGSSVLFRRRAGVHLLPAAVVVVVASCVVSYGYLFSQDWLHTILFAEYMGLGFVVYLGLATLLLADLVFNGARVTMRILMLPTWLVGSSVWGKD